MIIILTSRPVSLKSPISWVNAITRIKTRSPFDHVSLYSDRTIFESVAGKGVHSIPFNEWVNGREGTYLFCYKIPDGTKVDFEKFWEEEGKKYDYKANLLFLFGKHKNLKKKSTERYFCSELVATMIGIREPYRITPDNLEEYMRKAGWEIKIRKL